jgi:hypothetical protein
MSIAVNGREIQHHRASEQAALDRLVERLIGQFPELSRDEIVRTVHGQYAEYANSRVRDFVPVLVERRARRELTETPTARHRA